MFDKIVNSSKKITMADIHSLLESVAPPGQKQEEKKELIKELFEAKGEPMKNIQGISILNDIETYSEF